LTGNNKKNIIYVEKQGYVALARTTVKRLTFG